MAVSEEYAQALRDLEAAQAEIERLREALQAAKTMRAELAEDDGFLHSDACWNWAACESSKRQCAVCDFDDQIRALAATGETDGT